MCVCESFGIFLNELKDWPKPKPTSYFCASGQVILGSSFRSNLVYLVALPSERVSPGGIGIQIQIQLYSYSCGYGRHIIQILVKIRATTHRLDVVCRHVIMSLCDVRLSADPSGPGLVQ